MSLQDLSSDRAVFGRNKNLSESKDLPWDGHPELTVFCHPALAFDCTQALSEVERDAGSGALSRDLKNKI